MALDFLDQLEADAAARNAQGPSDLALDGLLTGALEGDEASALRAELDANPALAERYAAMQVEPPLDDVRILSTLAQNAPKPSIWQRLFDFRILGGLIALGGAAAAVVMMSREPPAEPTGDPFDPGVRMKGQLKLELRRKRGEVVERVAPGDGIRATDRVRFVVGLDARSRVGIVGVEADGTLYTAWPLPEHTAQTIVGPGKSIELPGAVTFAGSGEERLYLVACAPDVEPKCTSTGPKTAPTCPDGCRTAEFFVRLE